MDVIPKLAIIGVEVALEVERLVHTAHGPTATLRASTGSRPLLASPVAMPSAIMAAVSRLEAEEKAINVVARLAALAPLVAMVAFTPTKVARSAVGPTPLGVLRRVEGYTRRPLGT